MNEPHPNYSARRAMKIARCLQQLTIKQGERIQKLEAELAQLREVAERNALGILAITNGAKAKK